MRTERPYSYKNKKYSGEWVCKQCHKLFICKSGIERVYCSNKCRNISNVGKKQTEEHKLKISLALKGRPAKNKGIKHSEEHCKKISVGLLGKRKGIKLSEEHKKKLRENHKGMTGRFGELSGGWKGGVTTVNYRIRRSRKCSEWRTAVFKRDDYTCQECKIRGGELQADHIKPFAFYIELRFELSNGRTLCKDCHRRTETWGRKIDVTV